jgi:WhiB family transcriptional regulator, redox-sensing transcriptional regulator
MPSLTSQAILRAVSPFPRVPVPLASPGVLTERFLGRVRTKMEEPVRGLTMGSFVPHGSHFLRDPTYRRDNGWGLINDWEEQAACKDTDIRLWFGDEEERTEGGHGRAFRSPAQTKAAKAICARCPVLDDCRRWAMETRIPFGIVGAMTEVERKQLLGEGEAAWGEFWRQQDKALGRRKRMSGNHNGNKTHCKHGHPYSRENTYLSQGKRFCVACRNIRNKQYQLRKRKELGDWLWVDRRREKGHLAG